MGLRNEAKPLGVEQVTTSPVPVGQAGAKLCDPLRLPTEADKGSTPAYGRLRQPLRQGMLAGEIDGRLGSLSRRIELVPEVMQNRGKVQPEGKAVRACSVLSDSGGDSQLRRSMRVRRPGLDGRRAWRGPTARICGIG